MKIQAILVLTLLLTVLQPALSKPSLPVAVSVKAVGSSGAELRVVFESAASDVTLTVVGTGSVVLPREVHQRAKCARGEVIVLRLGADRGPGDGGLAVEVRGDFGYGAASEVRAFSLSHGDSVRAKKTKAKPPAVIILPAKTSSKPRPAQD